MKKMNAFFEFSSGERRGIIVMAALILLLLGVRLLLKLLPPPAPPPLDAADYRLFREFEARQQFLADSLDSVWEARRHAYADRHSHQYKRGEFRRAEWKSADKTASATQVFPFSRQPEKRTLSAARIDLNRADTVMLQTIPGIGARIARELVAYRERLGGFADLGQLLEVRFMDSARLAKVMPYLTLDTVGTIRKININKADVRELVRHPYVDYYLAKTIVVNRENKGAYRSLDEMRAATRIYPELFNRLKPYLETK